MYSNRKLQRVSISPNRNDPPAMITEIDSVKKRQVKDLFPTPPYKFAGYCKPALTKAFLYKKRQKQKDKLHLVVL
jgi:hypothetical protein